MPRARFQGSWDFSFSGIKTELSRRLLREQPDEAARARLAASYQEAIARTLADLIAEAAEELGGYPVVVVGGVARNRRLRTAGEIAKAQPAAHPDRRAPTTALCRRRRRLQALPRRR
jgi:N6-L-threonylcarbamoyladenine synthase